MTLLLFSSTLLFFPTLLYINIFCTLFRFSFDFSKTAGQHTKNPLRAIRLLFEKPKMPFPAILSPSQSQVGNRSLSSVFRCKMTA